MVTVQQATNIVLSQIRDHGTEVVAFEQAVGRVLAKDILADRDLPPFDRATMDGIALRSAALDLGIGSFRIKATQAAGEKPVDVDEDDQCIEIMTGAALAPSLDTVIRYEDLEMRNGMAAIVTRHIRKGQNIHVRGKDRLKDEVIVPCGSIVTPAVIGIAATVGEVELEVKKLPKIVVISSGDELVDVNDTPEPYQIRRSNNYTVKAALLQHGITADTLHLPDEPTVIRQQLSYCLQCYDVLLLSGGVSMGKFDHIPAALEELDVEMLFHTVQQRPGKPFWFGAHRDAIVFAFPGNPVATFMCLNRYFFPWLRATLGLTAEPAVYGALTQDVTFEPQLQYFMQVTLHSGDDARLMATPLQGNGSGDHANLTDTDGFMELPAERNVFKADEVYRVWRFDKYK